MTSIRAAGLIEQYYTAFNAHDGVAMGALYADGIHFTDPIFDLRGEAARAMCRMNTHEPSDLRLALISHQASGEGGMAAWRATYTFSATGRRVVNEGTAEFRFADDQITAHHDDFSFHRWVGQALGFTGLLLGWTPMLRTAVQKKAAARLAEFQVAEAGTA
jgi:ketosteroid isomerase-like protein